MLDPNTLSADGTVALAGTAVSKDGKHLAYGIAAAGSDWKEWRVRDVDDRQGPPGRMLRWIKFSAAAWTPDGQGFYYGRFPEPKPGEDLKGANYYQKVYYHRLGTPQADDRLVWRRPDHKEWRADRDRHRRRRVPDLDRVARGRTTSTASSTGRWTSPRRKPVHLVGDFDAEYTFIDNDGPVFWFKTNKNAPAAGSSPSTPAGRSPSTGRRLIPQAAETLDDVDVVGDRFIALYLKDAHTLVAVFDLDGRHGSRGRLARPRDGRRVSAASGRTSETFYSFTSFTTPATIYRYDVASGKSSVWRQPRLKFDPRRLRDDPGLLHEQGRHADPDVPQPQEGPEARCGPIPTLLYGYGGFNISLTPTFSPADLAWMEMGGSTPVPTCAAAASMARSGTRRARSSRSRTCSTTSSPRPSG